MAISSRFTLAAPQVSHQHRHYEFKGRKINDLQKWRRGWDSNPRYGFPHARFRGECFQPLSHLSAVVADLIVAEQWARANQYARQIAPQEIANVIYCLRATKNDWSTAAASAARMP